MDFKKFATFIAILGLATLGWGAYRWATNQPKTFKPGAEKQGMFGLPDFAASMDNLVAADNVRIENVHREEIRDSAIKIMVAGGIVLFIGLAVSASAKTSSNVLPSATPKQPIAAQGIAFRSQQINRVAAVIVLGVIALIVVVWFVMSSLPSDPLPSPNMDKSFLR